LKPNIIIEIAIIILLDSSYLNNMSTPNSSGIEQIRKRFKNIMNETPNTAFHSGPSLLPQVFKFQE
jgi:hypothetical protein